MTEAMTTDRTESMSRDEFLRWAETIGLTGSQIMPVWFVIGREYERGRAAALGQPEPFPRQP